MKGKNILSQPPLKDEQGCVVEDKENQVGVQSTNIPREVVEQDLKSSDVYSMLYLNPDVEDSIVKEMIAYACVIAEGSENVFPVRFSDINGKKVLIICRNFENPMEVEELLSISYAAYLSSDA